MATRRELEDLIGDISIYGPLDIPSPTPNTPVLNQLKKTRDHYPARNHA